ncbi:MAG: hypothetical protein US45_C0015G0004 [Candidatus Nomurabacteria bacterium GW2011_GWA1_37_20]|uniref:Uncharacterized protein n=1 Tax=Candidatus Nomurabacteria bacterium GW2011_GWA1_37_20 TaxID=1618729 RepID=A0A0G0GSC7_9BACT|nr:MAG: hypothetical protein US33_C0036G0007 [Parcubacteria group bacterium GW2011_GWC1_36_9]KKQ27688.1 MAG: hypothetical protein US41_C0015G0006 [Parcubacteria group bacterium GW2011_GWB1_37_13]KKQ32942.1 MAG: hypothetical protein US45_C0015G0004 [Candidatus Nomurabacteria bacterium GW2011_GWA1_37_20]
MERLDNTPDLPENIEIKIGLKVIVESFLYEVESKKADGRWLLFREGPNKQLVPRLHITLTEEAIKYWLKKAQKELRKW